MKTPFRLFLSTFAMLCFNQLGFSQSDVAFAAGHLRVPGYYVGWTPGVGSTPGPLEIRNNFLGAGQPINFFTGGVGGVFQRMTILGGPVGGPTTGFVGTPY